MKKARKALLTLCAALLLVTMTVGVTIAYLTDDASVTNTFTVGNIEITMDETNVDGKDAAGNENANEVRDVANKYHLLPGHSYVKDPTVKVAEGSEDCYLYVVVTNELEGIEGVADDDAETYDSIANQMAAKKWTNIPNTNVYYATNDAENIFKAGQSVVVFDGFTVKGTVEETALAEYATKKIEIKAYAIQADGFDSATEAWEAADLIK